VDLKPCCAKESIAYFLRDARFPCCSILPQTRLYLSKNYPEKNVHPDVSRLILIEWHGAKDNNKITILPLKLQAPSAPIAAFQIFFTKIAAGSDELSTRVSDTVSNMFENVRKYGEY
jgi:hypothetical protein